MSTSVETLLDQGCQELTGYFDSDNTRRLFHCADDQGNIVFETVRVDRDKTTTDYNKLNAITPRQKRRYYEAQYALYAYL